MWCETPSFPENVINYICIWRKGNRVPQSPPSWKITKSFSICSLSRPSQALWNGFGKLSGVLQQKSWAAWIKMNCFTLKEDFLSNMPWHAHGSLPVIKTTSKNHIFDTDHVQVLWPDKLKSLLHSCHILFTLPPATMRTWRALRSLFP